MLETHGVLRRFVRGWYVTEGFDLAILSQSIALNSYISFGTVLARELLIGPRPERQILAVKDGRTRRYRGLGYEIAHLGVAPHLFFGYTVQQGVRYADAEKAVLDVLYFHLRGRRYSFDVYSDIRFDDLDRARLSTYLERYENPKFITFARRVVGT